MCPQFSRPGLETSLTQNKKAESKFSSNSKHILYGSHQRYIPNILQSCCKTTIFLFCAKSQMKRTDGSLSFARSTIPAMTALTKSAPDQLHMPYSNSSWLPVVQWTEWGMSLYPYYLRALERIKEHCALLFGSCASRTPKRKSRYPRTRLKGKGGRWYGVKWSKLYRKNIALAQEETLTWQKLDSQMHSRSRWRRPYTE